MLQRYNFWMRTYMIAVIVIIAGIAIAAGYFLLKYHQPAPERSEYAKQMTACRSIPNDSTLRETETSRLFINLPKNIYPAIIDSYFKTVTGNATVGFISNGGPQGAALQATPSCSSTYYEFEGTGEVDLKVPSLVAGTPDYSVRFIVGPTQ